MLVETGLSRGRNRAFFVTIWQAVPCILTISVAFYRCFALDICYTWVLGAATAQVDARGTITPRITPNADTIPAPPCSLSSSATFC